MLQQMWRVANSVPGRDDAGAFNSAHTALAIANVMLASYRRTKTPCRDAKQTRETNGLLTNLFYSCQHVASAWLMCGQICQLAFFRCRAVGRSLVARRGLF